MVCTRSECLRGNVPRILQSVLNSFAGVFKYSSKRILVPHTYTLRARGIVVAIVRVDRGIALVNIYNIFPVMYAAVLLFAVSQTC